MARSGITYTEVSNVCNSLSAQGVRPTVDRIREQLGTGSRTTINEYKRQWEAQSSGQLNQPGNISESIQQLITQLSEQLNAEALAINEQKEQAHQKEMAEKDELLREAGRRHEIYQSRIDTLETNYQALKSKTDTLQKYLNKEIELRSTAEGESRQKAAELEQQQQHNRSLEEKHQQARQALEHYRQAAQEQRQQDQQRWEQSQNQSQQEIKHLRDALACKNSELSALNQQNGTLVAEKQGLDRQLRLSEQQVRELQDKLTASESTGKDLVTKTLEQAEQLSTVKIQAGQLRHSVEMEKQHRLQVESEIKALHKEKSETELRHQEEQKQLKKTIDDLKAQMAKSKVAKRTKSKGE